ncbi:MbcA/ParS/Xre antitoxin family protein [Sphingomonas sp. SUN019]|uniref:MbcA/ParS/Xre antitoxin family protein n=1 Tax=Sphingomonas sp. SUN019 TaxID=2937788 RepID=UPI0021645CA0|nr:MbcA/ParS/Xre antitoxin family protein [Sphingomonas sp. SUN019]UVO51372.1 MbcA/ParS/Xre antitoxin family protein [Sphingomonas sp. SUN019]
MLAAFLDDIRDGDVIAPKRMADRLRLPMTRLSKLAHLNRNTMAARPGSPAVQAKLGEIARIIARAAEMAGDEGRAIIWFKHQPIPGFGNRTAEQMVEDGHAAAVMWTLESMEQGVHA